MNKDRLKGYIPHAVAILMIFLVSAGFFATQFKGYNLRQMDHDNYLGMSKEIADYYTKSNAETFWTNSMFSGMPGYQIHVRTPWYVDVLNALRIGFNSIFEMPFGIVVVGMLGFYLLLYWFGVNAWLALIGAIAFGLSSINILFLAGGHNSKVIAISLIPPLVGALFYAFRKDYLKGALLVAVFTSLHVSANHLQMTYYLLFLIAGIVIFEAVKLYLSSGIKQALKITGFVAIAGLIGIIPASSSILSTYKYGNYTTRGKSELTIDENQKPKEKNSQAALGKDYIKEYSMGTGETWSIVVPNIKGGTAGYIKNEPKLLEKVSPQMKEMVGSRSTYWGEQRFSGGAFYFGAAIFLLVVLSLFFLKDKIKWVFLGVSLLSIMLSWKYGAILDWFIDSFPGFNKFRDTKMMLILPQLLFPLLAILFVNQLVKEQIAVKKIAYVSVGVLAFFGLLYLAPDTFFSFNSQEEQQFFKEQMQNYAGNSGVQAQLAQFDKELTEVRIAIMQSDLQRTIFVMLLTALVIILFASRKMKAWMLYLALGIIVLADLWQVDKRYLNDEKVGSQYVHWVPEFEYYNPIRTTQADVQILNAELNANPAMKTQIISQLSSLQTESGLDQNQINIEKEKEAFRLLNLNTNYRVFSLSNPFANSQPSYFHKSIGGYHGAKLKKYQEVIDFHLWKEYSVLAGMEKKGFDPNMAQMYLEQEGNVLNMLNTKYIAYNQGGAVFENKSRFGNAWFVKSINFAENADKEILALQTVTKDNAIIRKTYQSEIKPISMVDTSATIVLSSYLPNKLVYKVQSKTNQFAVFSEIYYPNDWQATVKNEEATIYPVNYILRGLQLPAGEYEVVFEFKSTEMQSGRMVGAIGSWLILAIAGFLLYKEYGKKKEKVA